MNNFTKNGMKNVLLTGLAALSLTACTDDIKDDIFDLQGDLALEQARLHNQANRIDDLQSELNTLSASVNLEISQINTTLVALANADDALLLNIEGVQAELVSAVASLTQADASNLIIALDAVTEAETSLILLLQDNVAVINASIEAAVTSSTLADADLQAQLDTATLALSNAVSVLTSADTATLAQAITAVSEATNAAEDALAIAVGDQATIDAGQNTAIASNTLDIVTINGLIDQLIIDVDNATSIANTNSSTIEATNVTVTALRAALSAISRLLLVNDDNTNSGFISNTKAKLAELEEAIDNIELIEGPQGIQGIQGIQGEPGVDGVDAVPTVTTSNTITVTIDGSQVILDSTGIVGASLVDAVSTVSTFNPQGGPNGIDTRFGQSYIAYSKGIVINMGEIYPGSGDRFRVYFYRSVNTVNTFVFQGDFLEDDAVALASGN